MSIRPKVWYENLDNYAINQIRQEAVRRFAVRQIPRKTAAEWKAYSKELREEIWSKLGTVYDPKLDLDVKITGNIKMNGYTVKKVVYQGRPGIYVTGNLYIPNGRGPFPGVINVHGHWQQGRLAERVQQRGHILAMNGYVCLSVDAWGSGERSSHHGEFEYHGANLGGSLLNIGETLMGAQVVDNMRGVDLLASLKNVDPKRLGVTGASGGGNQTMWLAAMDERLKAAVPVVSVGSFQSYVGASNCICELLPDGLTFTEESAVLALVAPRALKICNCLGDSNPTFFPAEMLRSYHPAREVFKELDAEDQISYQVFSQPHGYWPEIQETMLGWFELHLKGKGIGAPKSFKTYKTLPEEEVMVFEKGKRDKKVKSIAEYCVERGSELRTAFLKRTSFSEDRKRDEFLSVLKIEDVLEPVVHEFGEMNGWERLCLETQSGTMLPVLVKKAVKAQKGNKLNKFRVFSHPVGMTEIPDAHIEAALKDGYNAVLVDLSGTGQTGETNFTRPPEWRFHDYARGLMWLGRTLMGDWSRELDCVISSLRLWFNADIVSLQGYRETAVASLFAAAAYGEIGDVTMYDAPVSYLFTGDKIPAYFNMALLMPGFLGWGDISLAAALAKCPVKMVNPVLYDGTKVCEIEYGIWQKEFDSMRKKCHIDSGGIEMITE